MNASTRKIWVLIPLIGLFLLLKACSPKFEPEEKCNFVQNSFGERVSWNDQAPVELYVHNSVPKKYYEAIESAVLQWETLFGRRLFRVMGFVNEAKKPRQDGVSVIYWYQTWEEDREKEQARTTIYWTGNQIHEADIRINNKNHDYFVASDEDKDMGDKVDFESLIVHELGHVLGLTHDDQKGTSSVMAETLANAQIRREPSTGDLHSLRCEY